MTNYYRKAEYPFQPRIKRSKSFVNDRLSMPFMERLALDCQLREYKDQVIEKLNSSKEFRKSTHPKINKTSRSISRSFVDQNIPNHLYEDAFIRKQKMNSKRENKLKGTENDVKRRKSISMTNRIMDTLLNRKIEELFEILDSDNDGIISSNRINIKEIDGNKLKILAPLLIEMEDAGISLTFEDFKEAVKKLVKVIPISEKNNLLEFNQKRKAFTGSMKDCTFRVK